MNLKISNVSQNNFFAWNIDNFSALFLKFECFQGRRNNINKLYRTGMSGMVLWMYWHEGVCIKLLSSVYSAKTIPIFYSFQKNYRFFPWCFTKKRHSCKLPTPKLYWQKLWKTERFGRSPCLGFWLSASH
jgi:hypothetical protein